VKTRPAYPNTTHSDAQLRRGIAVIKNILQQAMITTDFYNDVNDECSCSEKRDTEHIEQGVALMGRNTTGPPRAAPGELRYAYTSVTDDDDRRQRPLLVWLLTPCVGGPVTRR